MSGQNVQVHRCQFTDLKSGSISAIAINNEQKKLACAREDGSIEIYSLGKKNYLEKRIPGQSQHPITKLEFYFDDELRLISTTLTGLVVEYSLKELRVKRYIYSEGSAVWCSKIYKEKMAIGCEDGSIKIIDLENGLEIVKSFQIRLLLGRILSIDWSKDGSFLFVGNDANTIEKVDSNNGNIMLSMKVEIGIKFKESYVWCLSMLNDNMLASGDSKGNVTIFETDFGTVLNTFRCHESDVLCLTSNKNGTELYSAGVDSKINKFICNRTNGLANWEIQSYRRFHDHDTKALAIFENEQYQLFSGGLDMKLSYVNLNSFSFTKYHSFNHFSFPGPIQLTKNGLVASMYSDHIKIWKLGKANNSNTNNKVVGEVLPLEEDYEEKVDFYVEGYHNILTYAISNNGKYIAISDVSNMRLCEIVEENNQLKINKVEAFPPKAYFSQVQKGYSSPKLMILSNNELILCNLKDEIFLFRLNNLNKFIKIPNKQTNITLIVNEDRNINVYDINKNELIFTHEETDPISSLLFINNELIICSHNWQTKTIDVKQGALSTEQYINPSISIVGHNERLNIPQLSKLPNNKGVLIYDSNNYCTLSKKDNPKLTRFNFEPLTFAGFFNNQLVVVEPIYKNIFSSLPPAFKSKVYAGDQKKRVRV
ncbi:WD40 repeat-like protein [Neoconidiobolus thromboides FSU 785]|nr:WD40 repeat-like protein [Neoconidiobolus thromboides FSU 785]